MEPETSRERPVRGTDEHYRLLLECVTDYALFTLDPQGNVAAWSFGAERLFGYDEQEILGQPFSRLFTPEDLAQGKPEQELTTAAVQGRASDNRWHVRKDGTQIWINGVTTALRDDAGNLRGFAKVTQDRTEQWHAQEKARRVAEELRRTAQQLAEADRRKDAFLAMLAHELRNPLAPVLNSLHLLRGNANPQAVEQARSMVERQIRHLSVLVDDLLDVSLINRGRVQLRRERLDLAVLVRTAVEDYRPSLERAGMSVVLNLPQTPAWIRGDATRLFQVLNNLLDNAIKFRNGGNRVMVRVAKDAGRRQAVVSVQDEGAGIEPAMLPRLFNIFAQAEQGLDRPRGGLGLGLALVKGLVELHGGEAQVASEGVGCGAVFTIRLPLAGEPAVLGDCATPAEHAGKHLRILVIEDNEDSANSLRALLQLQGHDVALARTGSEGVQKATQWHPDIVLSDIGLPGGLDGWDVARELRRNPATAQARLIAITGYGQEEDRRRSREAGFNGHLAKPLDPNVLQTLLTASGTRPER